MTYVTEPHAAPLPPPAPPTTTPVTTPTAPEDTATARPTFPTPDTSPSGEPPPPPSSPPSSPSGPRRHSAGHIIALVIGCLALLPSLGMLAGGIFVTVAQGVADDGYFDSTLDRVESDGVAVAAVDLWDTIADDEDWPWVLDWLDPDIRLDVRGGDSSREIFVGIAPTADVEAYLADAPFDEITDFSDREPIYRPRAGDGIVGPPADQTFWVAQAAGTGEQRVDWEARNGDWSVVVMNADGSPDVAADVTVGVSSDAVLPIGIVLIVLGGIGVLGSIVLIVVGARGRRTA